jgi:hypothetical protein
MQVEGQRRTGDAEPSDDEYRRNHDHHGDDVPAIQVDRRDYEPDHQEQHGIQALLDEPPEGHEMLLVLQHKIDIETRPSDRSG